MSSSSAATMECFELIGDYFRSTKKSYYSILDMGSGLGKNGFLLTHLALSVNCEISMIGVDIWKPYLQKVQKVNVYDQLILADARFLPFKPDLFDVILVIELLEHLPRDDGIVLLHNLERFLKLNSLVVVTTTHGFQLQGSVGGNPYEKHSSGWSMKDLRGRGYVTSVTPFVVKLWKSGYFFPRSKFQEVSLRGKLAEIGLLFIGALSLFFPRFSGKIIAFKFFKENPK